MARTPCVVIGSGNIGTDLMYKLSRSEVLELQALVGIDPESEGLKAARELGIEAPSEGAAWVEKHADEFGLVFDATSANVHRQNAKLFDELGLTAVDLTPAALGPAVVPSVNIDEHITARNVNLITCGGQATIPIVAAISQVADVGYAEMVSTVSSTSAGPGTRQNIDEFTKTTARGLERIGGCAAGKAIIVLNPADPPILMRNTVYCSLPDDADETAIEKSVSKMVNKVKKFVPGYRLKSKPLFDVGVFNTPSGRYTRRVTVLLEVEGRGDFLPEYAGNLDIMTSAATQVGEILTSASPTGANR